MTKLKPFDKHYYYEHSVQDPYSDIKFINKTSQEIRGKKLLHLREDFCGTYALSRAWVEQSHYHRADAYDIDPSPLAYGKERSIIELESDALARLKAKRENVLEGSKPKADIIAAFNFSYFYFKQRAVMRDYLKRCLAGLNPGGLLYLDAIGGSQCVTPTTIKRQVPGGTYFWELEDYDPIKNEVFYSIHFKRPKEALRKRVFTYHWRLWSVPELRELLEEVGFKRSYVYWEGVNARGEGTGKFSRRETGEPCETWIAYLIGEK